MKKFYTLLLTITISAFSFGQTFYSENMGTPSGTTAIATYITGIAPATFENASPILYSGTGDVRSSLVSSGYIGASGGGNVFITSTAGRYFQIEGINSSAYTTANLQLSFGYNTTNLTTQLVVEQSTDGTTWTPITFTNPAATGWSLVTITGGQILSSTTLKLRFTQPATTSQFRLDDIKLSNVSASCLLTLGADSTLCNASTINIDTYTATIAFTGGGSATYVINTTSGTVGGNNPSTTATGNITISGINEGTNITVTITGGTCNLSRNITAPECKTTNPLPFTENFNYTPGNSLGSEQAWTNINSGDNILAVSGNLTYTGVAAIGNSVSFSGAGIDTFSPFTTTTTGTIYSSFLMSVTDMSNVTVDLSETVFAIITDEAKGYNARIMFKKNGTQFQVGCTSVSALPAAGTVYGSTLYNVGSTVMVIVGYNFTTNELKMWLNPTLATFTAATPATVTETPAVAFANLGGFLLRQDTDTKTPTMTIDALKLAITTAQLGVAQNEINGLSMYPNPVVNGNLYITTDTNTSKEVAIFDVLGKQVLKTTITNQAVNVASLNAGIYIVKVTEEGKTATRKLVIN